MVLPADATYPLSDPAGKAIPFDVGDPFLGLFSCTFATAASAEKTLGADWEIAVFWATEDCVVAFGAGVTWSGAHDVVRANHLLVPRKTPTSIRLTTNKFKVARVSTDGVLFVQSFRRWQGISTETLQRVV